MQLIFFYLFQNELVERRFFQGHGGFSKILDGHLRKWRQFDDSRFDNYFSKGLNHHLVHYVEAKDVVGVCDRARY